MPGQPGALPSGAGIGDPSQLFEQFLGSKPEDYLDFVQDAGLGITYDNDKVGGGLVATVDDEATATARVAKIVSLLKLLGGGFGGGSGGQTISTSDADHNGTKVTTITVSAPAVDGATSAQPLSVQVAVANGRMYLGYGTFVTDSLDRSAADSLASNDKYQQAIAGGPSDNAGILFVDVASLSDLYAEHLPPTKAQDFNTNTKPFLDPLSSLSAVSRVDGGMVVINGFLYVQ
jgi:hypothetical protein